MFYNIELLLIFKLKLNRVLVTYIEDSLGKITQVLYYMEVTNGLERQQ